MAFISAFHNFFEVPLNIVCLEECVLLPALSQVPCRDLLPWALNAPHWELQVGVVRSVPAMSLRRKQDKRETDSPPRVSGAHQLWNGVSLP